MQRSENIHPNERQYYDYDTNEQPAFMPQNVRDYRIRFILSFVSCIILAAILLYMSIVDQWKISSFADTIQTQQSTITSLQDVTRIKGTQPVDGSVCYRNTINNVTEHWHVDIRRTLNSNGTLSETKCGPN